MKSSSQGEDLERQRAKEEERQRRLAAKRDNASKLRKQIAHVREENEIREKLVEAMRLKVGRCAGSFI